MPESEYSRGVTAGLAVPEDVLTALDTMADAYKDDILTLRAVIELFVAGFFTLGELDFKIKTDPEYKRGFTTGLTLAYGAHLSKEG
jgi:hypothetical protein